MGVSPKKKSFFFRETQLWWQSTASYFSFHVMAIVCVMANLLLTENTVILCYNFSLSDCLFWIFLEVEITSPYCQGPAWTLSHTRIILPFEKISNIRRAIWGQYSGNFAAAKCKLYTRSDPKVIKLFSCSTQLSTKFILLINVKMPTIVGIYCLLLW